MKNEGIRLKTYRKQRINRKYNRFYEASFFDPLAARGGVPWLEHFLLREVPEDAARADASASRAPQARAKG